MPSGTPDICGNSCSGLPGVKLPNSPNTATSLATERTTLSSGAVETGRPVLRAANTGISAVVDRYGRIQETAPLNTRAILTANIPLPLDEAQNFYTQWGDWFAWLCAALYFTLLISAMVFAYE